jgi:radical SAM/Cys-rich protein
MGERRTNRAHAAFKDFDSALRESSMFPLRSAGVEMLQINMGKLCNQMCSHCHVEAGPSRSEIISRENLEKCLGILAENGIENVELTGGAPEMNPNFAWFIGECRARDLRIVVRSNLTIMLEPGYENVPDVLRSNGVEIVASLPCYTRENVERQRGVGVFDKSIKALKSLNGLGYGKSGTGLILKLVYNPGGAFLPGSQEALENDYRKQLGEQHGIEFTSLLTITNMPIGRFKKTILAQREFETYMKLLIGAFNPRSAERVMCREIISVGWDGSLYDCDFNQMLKMSCDHGSPNHIAAFDLALLESRRIVTGLHCYGCTAGSGSSCFGALEGGAQ